MIVMAAQLPLYFNCFFFDKESQSIVRVYKIERTQQVNFPFHLFKHASERDGPDVWVDLSVYASVRDCVGTFLKELSSIALSDEIYHGQATVNPDAIIDKIESGVSVISIYDDETNETFRSGVDISFRSLVQREKMPERPTEDPTTEKKEL